MTDSPVEMRPYATGAHAFGWVRQERPRVVVKADLLPAVSVLSLVGLLGLLLGWIWSRLASPTNVLVVPGEEPAPLPMEDWHRFDALAIFLLLGLAAGVVTGVAIWFLRARRGPVILIAAVLGSLLAGWLAMRVGPTFVAGLYPVPAAPQAGDVLTRAPELSTGWALLAQPLTTTMAYLVLASWNGRDDLGRRLA